MKIKSKDTGQIGTREVYIKLGTLTLHDAPDLTHGGRVKLAMWLRKEADALLRDGDNYAKRYRARFLV